MKDVSNQRVEVNSIVLDKKRREDNENLRISNKENPNGS